MIRSLILALALLASCPAWATCTAGTGQTDLHCSATSTAISQAVALTSNPATGDLLVCATGSFQTVNICTDSLVNTWAQAGSSLAIPGGGNLRIDYAIVASGGADTVTCHIAVSDDIHCHVYRVHGIASSTPLDKTGTNSGTTAITTVSSASTTQASEYVFAVFYDVNHNTTFTVGGCCANRESLGNVGSDTMASEDQIVSATGVQTSTMTNGAGAVAYGGITATFKNAGVGAAAAGFNKRKKLEKLGI